MNILLFCILSSDNSFQQQSFSLLVRIWDIRPFAPQERCVKIIQGHQHNFEKVGTFFYNAIQGDFYFNKSLYGQKSNENKTWWKNVKCALPYFCLKNGFFFWNPQCLPIHSFTFSLLQLNLQNTNQWVICLTPMMSSYSLSAFNP